MESYYGCAVSGAALKIEKFIDRVLNNNFHAIFFVAETLTNSVD